MEDKKLIDETTRDQFKREGLKEWLKWNRGCFRRHFKIGKDIIKRYGIEEEVEQVKLIKKRRASKLLSRRFRKHHQEKINLLEVK